MSLDQYSQNIILSSKEFEGEKQYWLENLQGEIIQSAFPAGFSSNIGEAEERRVMRYEFKPAVYGALVALSKNSPFGLYMILLAAFKYLLFRYTGCEDIIVSTPVFKGATQTHSNNHILLLRTTVSQKGVFKDLLLAVKQTVTEADKHSHFPYVKLVELLGLERRSDGTPYLKTVVLLEQIHDPQKLKDISADTVLSFSGGDSLSLTLEYNTGLYPREMMAGVTGHLDAVLTAITQNPNIELAAIEILSIEEQRRLLSDFNNTQAEYSTGKTIHQLFEDQVSQTPERIAVVFKDQSLTYRELNAKANQLVRLLLKKGVGPNQIVAIMVERSLEMVIGILGVLKAGAAYIPLDPGYPDERIKYLLNDSGANLLLVQKSLPIGLKSDIANIEIDTASFAKEATTNLMNMNRPQDPAYVIYTSGTTGKPKGVLVEHQSIAHNLMWRKREYAFGEDDVILQLFSYIFDGFLTSFFTPVISGAKVLLLTAEDAINPIAIKNWIVAQKVTHFISVPALYQAILDELTPEDAQSLRIVTLAGERANPRLIEQSKGKKAALELVNEYGPTESTVVASVYRDMLPGAVISIGKPIANTRIYIRGKFNQLQPVGVPGELWIAGVGLARGYLNQPELTAEKFVVGEILEFPLQRIYRTGDLARWLPDGNLEFSGRIDHQVKIRGYRIELGEIDTRLLKYETVHEAIAIAGSNQNGDTYLCAYLTAGRELTTQELHDYLAGQLPEHMIPSYFVQLDHMPLTPNGKIDRGRLPKPQGNIRTGKRYVAPRNEIERKLAGIWQEILGVEPIGIEENFFELGGHSLKVTTLVSRIQKELNVEVPMREVFNLQTIRELTKYIAGQKKSIYASIEPVTSKAHYALSSAQKRLYILHQLEGVEISYNNSLILTIEGNLDVLRFEKVFHTLVQRHESFRTSFELIDGEPVQKVHPTVEFRIEYFDSPEGEDSNLEGEDFNFEGEDWNLKGEDSNPRVHDIIRDFIRPFDLRRAPLCRVGLIKLTPDKHIMMTDMHHIISDGLSANILMKEFISLYEGNTLPGLRIQYKDYAAWQNFMLRRISHAEAPPDEIFSAKFIKRQEEYWLDRFSGAIPVLNLPTDFPRPLVRSFAGDRYGFELDLGHTGEIKRLAAATGTTLYMLLLAVYQVLLFKYTGQEDILTGSPIAGRPHADLENIIGMFVNTLVMRNYPVGNKSFREFLGEVKENSLKAYENQDYPFEELVEKLELQRDLSRNPLFDVMFVLDNIDLNGRAIRELKFIPYQHTNPTAKFDITFEAIELNEQLFFSVEYCTHLFLPETIHRLSGHFLNTVMQILENPDIKLAAVNILTDAELGQIIHEFNNTLAEYPHQKTIHQLFEEQVERIPNNVALRYQERQFCYRELNERSNQLAHQLRELGAAPNRCIGLIAERSMEMVIGILGILKAGSAYLPVDPRYPEARINYLLKDASVDILIVRSGYEVAGLAKERTVIVLDVDVPLNNKGSNLDRVNGPSDLAYIMYTSGSTGRPKGVMVEHQGVVRLVKNTNYIHFEADDRVLLTSAVMFDVTTFEIWGPLLNGLELCLISEMEILDPSQLGKALAKYHITTLWLTSALFNHLEQQNPELFRNLKYLLVGGDALAPKHINRVRSIGESTIIINGYGPTENTTFSTCFTIDRNYDQNIPIGRPISNSTAYILNRDHQIQPIGVPGELWVGGDGVARGYLNQPELTAEKFVVGEIHEFPLQRIYRTGDLARWLPDGNIEFLGRADHQVKIRGFRIELGEIETQLLLHPAIKEAIITVKEDQNASGVKNLCAYFVSERELSVPELREYMAQDLPDYMIPAYFIQLEKMPLTPNGKINRKVLPEPAGIVESGVPYVAPRNENEIKLARIWQEVLKLEQVGIQDEFLVLGGDSLKALKAAAEAVHQNIHISINDIFKYKTIANILENTASDLQAQAASSLEEDQQTDAVPDIVRVENKWSPFVLYRRDDPEIKELTIEVQRDITIYLHRALPLCVVLADPNLHPWYYEHFINIFSATDSQGFLTLDYLEIHAPYRDAIGEIALGAKQMERETDIIQYLREQINQGFYLNIVVDEFYLPGKPKYRKIHYVHHVLVYGYDNIKQKVKGLGFNNGGVFAELIFSYQAFAEAYEKGKQFYQDSAPWAFRTAVQLFYNNGFSSPHPFRIDKFLTELHNYLYSIGDEGLIYYWRLKQEEVAYGLGVYELVLRHLQNLLQGKMTTDYRAIHLLAEHKKGIAKRLHYIINRYHISDLLLEPYQKYLGVVDQFNDIRLKFFDLQYDLNAGRIKNSGKKLTMALEQLMARIGSVREKERMILSEIYEILKSLSPETMSPAEVIISNNHETTNNR